MLSCGWLLVLLPNYEADVATKRWVMVHFSCIIMRPCDLDLWPIYTTGHV